MRCPLKLIQKYAPLRISDCPRPPRFSTTYGHANYSSTKYRPNSVTWVLFVYLSLSGGFTPCRDLRPSSGQEQTVAYLIRFGDDHYLMKETRRKPTTRTRCPTLFDKWHGICYRPIPTATHSGWTYEGLYLPNHGLLGDLIKVLRHKAHLNCRPVGPQSNTPTTRPRWPPQVEGSC